MIIDITQYHKVNLLMSGGADSSLLLFLLLREKQLTNPDVVIQCHTKIDGGRIDYLHVKPVLEWFRLNQGIKLHTKALRKLEMGTTYIRELATKLIEVEGGVVFSGCNKVPDEASEWEIRGPTPYRGEETHPLHFRPFMDLSKIDILRMYVEYDILDLLPITHSCLIHIREHRQCGKCFFCRELNWAKKELGI